MKAVFNDSGSELWVYSDAGEPWFGINITSWIESGYREDGDGGWIKFQKAKGGEDGRSKRLRND